ncbi:hypothetical protein BS17DRAFT_882413 [Gyrodon lividus]|nr:hypothetical protein BS17DRAFT_882413 [Gyrodon lividus]
MSGMDDFVNTDVDHLELGPGRDLSWGECLLLLSSIVEHSGGQLDPEFTEKKSTAKRIQGEWKDELMKQLNEAWKTRSYRSIRNLERLQNCPLRLGGDAGGVTAEPWSYGVQAEATVRSWEREYVGDAADALWAHIQEHVGKQLAYGPNACQTRSQKTSPEHYAQYATIVQSSGTGKSRAIDEMSKSHFVIPINLRDQTTTGYPPRDADVCSYFRAAQDQKDAFSRACAFLQALFDTTKGVLSGDILSDLARFDKAQPAPAQFRGYMKAAMKHGVHGEFRRKFYAVVCSEASQLVGNYKTELETVMGHMGATSGHRVEKQFMNDTFGVKTAFQSLCEALKAFKALQSHAGEPPKKKKKKEETAEYASKADDREWPFVIVSFDEIHTLAQVRSNQDFLFSIYGEVRRGLRPLANLPFFALFLTTTGKLEAIMPPPERDLSSRIQHGGNSLIPSFFDLGFDQVAKKVNVHSGRVTLSSVSSEDQLCTYGRPLWGTRYEIEAKEVKNDIISFAASKLLSGEHYDSRKALDLSSKLACLATRLPIEFLSTSYASHAEEMKQVEGHLRFVLRVDENMESMITVSPSEPILSEAAYWIMQNSQFHLPDALLAILGGLSVNKGDRGELLVMLLFTIARDTAVGHADSVGKPVSGARTCLLTQLLRSLFDPPKPSNRQDHDHVDVLKSRGHHLEPAKALPCQKLLQNVFASSVVYFNHFIKVHQHELVHINYLMYMMARGAAMLCATNQPGIDGILPFLLDGDTISASNVGVVLWQVKNDSSFTDNPDLGLFDAMDPYQVGIFTAETQVPIIRIVFALASKKPCLKAVKCMGAKTLPFVTHDLWVAGLDKNILVPIGEETNIWDALLQKSHGWKDIYNTDNERAKVLRQSGNPAAADGKGHWIRWTEGLESDLS